MLAYISCDDTHGYSSRRAKAGTHGELMLYIRFGHPRDQWAEKGAFHWRRFAARPTCVKEAISMLRMFIETHPDHDWGIAEQSVDAAKGTV